MSFLAYNDVHKEHCRIGAGNHCVISAHIIHFTAGPGLADFILKIFQAQLDTNSPDWQNFT